jgi:hypothetical protein
VGGIALRSNSSHSAVARSNTLLAKSGNRSSILLKPLFYTVKSFAGTRDHATGAWLTIASRGRQWSNTVLLTSAFDAELA